MVFFSSWRITREGAENVNAGPWFLGYGWHPCRGRNPWISQILFGFFVGIRHENQMTQIPLSFWKGTYTFRYQHGSYKKNRGVLEQDFPFKLWRYLSSPSFIFLFGGAVGWVERRWRVCFHAFFGIHPRIYQLHKAGKLEEAQCDPNFFGCLGFVQFHHRLFCCCCCCCCCCFAWKMVVNLGIIYPTRWGQKPVVITWEKNNPHKYRVFNPFFPTFICGHL